MKRWRNQRVTNALDGRRWNGEHGVVRVGVRIGVVAVPEVARIVIVQQVVVALFAVRIDRTGKRLEVIHNRATPG